MSRSSRLRSLTASRRAGTWCAASNSHAAFEDCLCPHNVPDHACACTRLLRGPACARLRRAHQPRRPGAAQAYDRWLRGDHAHLFIINNDVLVPSGVLTQLMRAMRRGGTLRGLRKAKPPWLTLPKTPLCNADSIRHATGHVGCCVMLHP